MLRKTVPDPYSSDWKCSVAIGWESGTGNRHCQTVHEMKWNADAFETSTLLDNVQRKFKVLTYTRIIRSISVKFTFILTDLYKFVTTQHIKYIIPWFQHPRSVCDFFCYTNLIDWFSLHTSILVCWELLFLLLPRWTLAMTFQDRHLIYYFANCD